MNKEKVYHEGDIYSDISSGKKYVYLKDKWYEYLPNNGNPLRSEQEIRDDEREKVMLEIEGEGRE